MISKPNTQIPKLISSGSRLGNITPPYESQSTQISIKVSERFFLKVEQTKSCWNWTAFRNQKGYGKFGYKGKSVQAHRFSYELHKGKIPEGLQLDHLCRNTSCVNPEHLEAVTLKENVHRSVVFYAIHPKTHCIHGHFRTKENTYFNFKKNIRECRTCLRIKHKNYRLKNREILAKKERDRYHRNKEIIF